MRNPKIALAWGLAVSGVAAACGGGTIVPNASVAAPPCGHAGENCCVGGRCTTGAECAGGSCARRENSGTTLATACPDDHACSVGACPVVDLPNGAAGIVGWLAVGGDRVWWTAGNLAAVGYVDRCGGGGATVTTTTGGATVAADANSACWSVLGTLTEGKPNSDGEVDCFDNAGVHQLATGQGMPWGLGLDHGTVYWASDPRYYEAADVYSATMGSSDPPAVLTKLAFWDEPVVALDDQRVYVGGAGGVFSVLKTGGAPTTLALGSWDVRSIAVDDANVYFPDVDAPHVANSGQVLSVPKLGGETTVLATADNIGNQIATDGLYVYFVADDVVQRVPTSGGAVETIAKGAQRYGLAADGVYVYFASLTTVYRVRSP